jgi:peptidoglycan/xylan/chitin deacetylase (PgdA/CDA1 family)
VANSIVRSLPVLLAALLLVGWTWPRPPALRLPRFHRAGPVDVPILEYHRVSDDVVGIPGLTVSPAQFAAEMEWLHGAGYHALTQMQLYDALRYGAPLPPRPVLITFDDGYRDVLWNAVPLLRRLRMPATVYVITDRPGGRDPSFLDWPELRRLDALGFDIGSHTIHHVSVGQVPPAEAYAELAGSRAALQGHLGHPVPWLSYPHGSADPRDAARAGYLLAVTESPGSVQAAPLLLHRYEILPSTGVAGVRALVESASG